MIDSYEPFIPIVIDFYGYIVGCDLTTYIATPLGIMHLRLRKRRSGREFVIEAEITQFKYFLDSKINDFSATVDMRSDGDEYRIIQSKRYPRDNALWQQLERLISNTIIVNE